MFSLIFLSQCLLSKMGEIQRQYLHQLHSVWPRPYFVVYELKTSVYCRYSAIIEIINKATINLDNDSRSNKDCLA